MVLKKYYTNKPFLKIELLCDIYLENVQTIENFFLFQIDLGDIKAKYKQLYKKTLEDDIDSECSGDFKKLLLALLK